MRRNAKNAKYSDAIKNIWVKTLNLINIKEKDIFILLSQDDRLKMNMWMLQL